MAEAKQGDTVHIHYTGKLADGTVFDSSADRDPLSFTLGEGEVIPGFEDAVSGMTEGDNKTATVPSDRAYGPRRDELVLTVPKEQLPGDMEPEVGQQLRMQTADGQTFVVTVTGTDDSSLEVDANHPLAGRDLTFDIELVRIG